MVPRPCFLSIQSLRGIAALLVVLFHLRIVEAKYGAGDTMLPAMLRFADAGVDLFFVISGFVMVTVAAGRYGSPANAMHFFARRTWRVVPPYWFYTTVVVTLMLIAPGMANGSYQGQSILASYLLWPHAQLPVLTVGWTLVHEMYFYLVMAVAIATLNERHLPVFLLAWAGAIGIVQAAFQVEGRPVPALVFNPMTLEFIAGALAGLYWRALSPRLAAASLLMGTAGFVAGLVLMDRAGLPSQQPLLRTLAFGMAGVLIVTGAVALEARGLLRPPRWLVQLGDSSYSLYLSHVFVISAAGRIWQMTSLNTADWHHVAFLLSTVAACVLVGLASWRLLERPLLAAGDAWLGARPSTTRPQPA